MKSPLAIPDGYIDPHVHCRDEEQSHKATVRSVLELALSQGVGLIFDMPNPERPVTSRKRVYERLALVPKRYRNHYRLFAGLTEDPEQIVEAVWCYRNIPEVVGLKLFAGKSVGNLSVTGIEDQQTVFRVLTDQRYCGVVDVHAEKERSLRPELWDPSQPISHCLARPEEAENESVADMIDFATKAGYNGRIHICHVSSPKSVTLIQEAKKRNGLLISCGVTPHHLMYDSSMMDLPNGLMYKMNPPLRARKSVNELPKQLRAGLIDIIETDHAPHTTAEKLGPPYLSGFPSLMLYRQFVARFLPSLGLKGDFIQALTRGNILRIFGDKLR